MQNNQNKSKTIVIVGPTASGKSDVANLLASIIGGEVISADSMQIYKGMNIGTGKILSNKMKVPHWGIDLCSPGQAYSVALYQRYAREKINDIKNRNKIPILCGGTGFYVRAVIDDYDFPKGEQKNNPIRRKWEEYAKQNGSNKLWKQLNKRDFRSAEVIHENNVVRIIRALELYEEGKSYADQKNSLKNIKQVIAAKFFGLEVDPMILNSRIDDRVDAMIENGLIEEVKTLYNKGFSKALTSSSAIGYKEIYSYLSDICSLEKAIEQIKINTHRYAKRQRTWFRKDKRINWINYNKMDPTKAVESIIKCL